MPLHRNWLQLRAKGGDWLMGFVVNLEGKRVEREGGEEE